MCRYTGPLGALQGNISEGVYEAANMKATGKIGLPRPKPEKDPRPKPEKDS